jgi:hypothetical protein
LPRSARILIAADQRLTAARRREEAARRQLHHWDAWDLFSKPDVLAALGRGESDPAELRRLEPCLLSEDELRPFVAGILQEFTEARRILADRVTPSDYDWEKFRKASADLPIVAWPIVWEEVFENLVKARMAEANAEREQTRRAGRLAGMDPTPLLRLARPNAFNLKGITTTYDLQRRDGLAMAHERAKQRVEDYEDELQRLRDEHAEMIRPDGRLWWGIGILVIFAAIGVAWPLYLMSIGPTRLASVWWIAWPFWGVLAALVLYVVWYMVSLSRRKAPQVEIATDDAR